MKSLEKTMPLVSQKEVAHYATTLLLLFSMLTSELKA